ncbi:MAG: hypothetical protein JXX29_03740 [Deltaproteobacteria bacterium]|nr:hypothetical protein [Deltaproteobacteria bacterium]MBN2670755.1 hypothetical protein [Deltaproteobacteria bacterium]
MKLYLTAIVVCIFALCVLGCDDETNTSDSAADGTGLVQVTLGTNTSALRLRKLSDSPNSPLGGDLDSDGGVTAFATPSEFWIALKKVTFLSDDGEVAIVPDMEQLRNSELLNLTEDLQLDAIAIPAGNYHSAEMELYFYQVQLPLNSADNQQMIRIYLSDDDFSEQGMGGHHQGDITLVNDDGSEAGWVAPGSPWTPEYLLSERGDLVGAGGVDAQTGHARGLFGDSLLWDAELFQQGESKDIYILRMPLNLQVQANASSAVEIRFQTENSLFFEDFDGDNLFSPCQGGDENGHQDACWYDESLNIGADWAPIFYPPTVHTD